MARNVLCQERQKLFLIEKARSTMPMHSERRRRGRSRRRNSALDWFSEDPWAEPDAAALDGDGEDEWYPGLSESTGDNDAWSDDELSDAWSDDPYDGWGPIRGRRKCPSDRP